MNKSAGAKKFKDMVIIVSGGLVTFVGIEIFTGSEKFYRNVVMPTTFKLVDAEAGHRFAIKLAKHKVIHRPSQPDPPSLKTCVFGKEFTNPIGLAAGFDKDGEAVDGLLRLGFGFVEVGSVTPLPQPGNDKPRVFRLLEDKAVINRYGFNSAGHDVVLQRLEERKKKKKDSALEQTEEKGFPHMQDIRNGLNINFMTDVDAQYLQFNSSNKLSCKDAEIVGVNLGKNKTSPNPVDDYVRGVQRFGNVADYLVVNVSSPNTPGLRQMQGRQLLGELLDKVIEARNKLPTKPPLLLKIAPDLSDKDKEDIASAVMARKSNLGGLIVSNTTVSRPQSLTSPHKSETGGLSGEPLKDLATQTISDMYRKTKGEVPIIGVGGVGSGEDAYDKIKSGASLIQLYTALIFQGPPVVGKIKRELDELLRKDGYTSVSEAVGTSVKPS